MRVRFCVQDTEISFSFWFFAALTLFLALDTDGLAVVFLLPVLTHELGHLAAMWLFGVRIKSVGFSASGISIQKADSLKTSYAKEIIVAVSGAAANLLCALGLSFFMDYSERVMFLIVANIAVAAFNMLPIGSLDGGSLTKLLAQRFFPQAIAFALSRVFSFLALVPLFALAFFLALRPEHNFTLLAVAAYLAVDIIKSDW